MDGRIDPASSLHRFNAAKLAAKARDEELVLAFVNSELAGCLFAAPRKDSFYLGKIAVRPGLQGRGLARRMIALAEAGARSRNLKSPDLQKSIELTDNHRAFVALGFAQAGETIPAGFTPPTQPTFRQPF